MKTTINIPDDLLLRAKAAAAQRNMKLKDLIVELLEQGLNESGAVGQRRPIPVIIQAEGLAIKPLTNTEVDEIFLREDLARLGYEIDVP